MPALGLAEQQSGDQEAGEHEEDVDADEAAGSRDPGVVEHHEQDRDRAEALEILR